MMIMPTPTVFITVIDNMKEEAYAGRRRNNIKHVGYISTLHPKNSLHSHRLRKATSNIIMKFALAMKII